jgi:hypothetical protein
VILEAPTRFYLKNLYVNFKNKFKGKALKDLMWAVANETTKAGFNAKMEHIKVLNKDVEHLYLCHLCIETAFVVSLVAAHIKSFNALPLNLFLKLA